jgi:hypothetical protein
LHLITVFSWSGSPTGRYVERRLVPLISAIGASIFLENAHR